MLTSVSVSLYEDVGAGPFLNALATECIHLRELTLEDSGLSDESMSDLLIRCGTRLRKLDLHGSYGFKARLTIANIARYCPRIRHLNLSDIDDIDDSHLLLLPSPVSGLEETSHAPASTTTTTMYAPFPIKTAGLKYLYLRKTTITFEGLATWLETGAGYLLRELHASNRDGVLDLSLC